MIYSENRQEQKTKNTKKHLHFPKGSKLTELHAVLKSSLILCSLLCVLVCAPASHNRLW